MAEVPNHIIKHIKDYIKILNKKGFMIQQAILFGSFANGKYNEFSDIDLALVSDKFEGIRFNDRNLIRKYKFDINADIEPIPFTQADFIKKDPFVTKTLKRGAKALGIASANLINIIGVHAIIIGGGLYEELGQELLPVVRKYMVRHSIAGGAKDVDLVLSKLGDDAVALGAAWFVSLPEKSKFLYKGK